MSQFELAVWLIAKTSSPFVICVNASAMQRCTSTYRTIPAAGVPRVESDDVDVSKIDATHRSRHEMFAMLIGLPLSATTPSRTGNERDG